MFGKAQRKHQHIRQRIKKRTKRIMRRHIVLRPIRSNAVELGHTPGMTGGRLVSIVSLVLMGGTLTATGCCHIVLQTEEFPVMMMG